MSGKAMPILRRASGQVAMSCAPRDAIARVERCLYGGAPSPQQPASDEVYHTEE
jgi:hypothetical protein